MRPEFTPSGVSVRTFDEIFNSLADSLRAIYGPDINLDQDTPDGQLVGIIAKQVLDAETFGLSLYGEFDPDFARGELLNKIIKLVGINRRPATRSTVDIEVVTDRALTLPDGYALKDDAGQSWITTEEKILVNGTNTVSFVSEQFGAIEAPAGTITEQDTVVLGVVSVTNPLDAVVGIEEETDEQLRQRRNKSLENAAYSTVGGLFAKLADVSNVVDVVVYENDTDATDSDGIPAHGIWVVIDGGDVADIAEVMAKNKTAGTSMKGSIDQIYSETIIRPDGSEFIISHEMKFDRPTDIDLYIELTATRKDPTSPVDIDLIKNKLVENQYNIGINAVASELYSIVYEAGSNFVATDLLISDDDITYTDENLIAGNGNRFVISTSNITVTEVV